MKNKLAMRVKKGALIPADRFAETRLREMKLAINDIVFVSITKPRNPAFNRLVHAFGEMVAENIESFSGMGSHDVLKRIQAEAGIACKPLAIRFPGVPQLIVQNIPQSLSFADMDEVEFREVYLKFCRWIAEQYWPDLEPEKIADMAELMAEE